MTDENKFGECGGWLKKKKERVTYEEKRVTERARESERKIDDSGAPEDQLTTFQKYKSPWDK